jgi:hypothetical protein
MTETTPKIKETASQPEQTPRKSIDKRTLWAIIALAGPSVLWIITFIIAAATNLAFASIIDTSAGFDSYYPAQVALNILSFLLGAIAFLTWLPGIIIGIVLLETRK